ncbi:MAG: hypothetical protein U0360_05785 [Dehalococcoidia bacterium]
MASADELADAFVAGAPAGARCSTSMARSTSNCLAHPPGVDHERWQRSFALVRLVEGAPRQALLALGTWGTGRRGGRGTGCAW